MKKIYITVLSILVLSIASCSDYLDTKPGDKYDDGAVWSSPSLAQSFVFDIYRGVPYPYQWFMNASLVDEAVSGQYDGVVARVVTSTMTPDDKGVFAKNWSVAMENWWWDETYDNIRACNLFFEKIDDVPFVKEDDRNQLKGEVYFLRAYFYNILFVQYGGVPLISHSFNIGDNYNIPRNTLAETVDFIVSDLDKAADLVKNQTDKTRATTGAVLALKSRVLLYAASDLFNSQASWASGYSNPELVSYMDANRNARWTAAKDAAADVMALGKYSLYEKDADPVKNFENLFLSMSSDEQIFITKYDKINFPFYGTDWLPYICGTPTYGGYELNQVTANLADAFENKDGSKFNLSAQSADPYANRDPRFYATILYNGADWVANGGWQTYYPSVVRNGKWIKNENGQNVIVGAPDYAQNTPINTGYFIRKFIDPDFGGAYYGSRQLQPCIQIRYAEVLLNYAEACIALGEEGEAQRVMNLIRTRAGMPDVTDTGQALIDRYRNERRVELAWETHRFFDVRRWMIAPEAYVPAKGIDITYPVDESTDNPIYKEVTVENRAWNNSHYLIPISRDEMQKNTVLIQNPIYQ